MLISAKAVSGPRAAPVRDGRLLGHDPAFAGTDCRLAEGKPDLAYLPEVREDANMQKIDVAT